MKLYNATYYHGSGTNFDKFDLSFMSTGEGCQAHGWGIYLAENKSTASKYEEIVLGDNTITIKLKDGKEYKYTMTAEGDMNYHDIGYDDIAQFCLGWEWRLISENKLHGQQLIDELKARWEDDDDWFDNLANFGLWYNVKDITSNLSRGMLATVRVKDGLIFAREDKFIGEQSEEVIKVFKDMCQDLTMNFEDIVDYTFREWYEEMSNYYDSESMEDLSFHLQNYGIDGISYNGEYDGECLVLFNPDNCEIIEKE